MHRIALVGSSGGNLHRLGGADPAQLIRSVRDQLGRAGIELGHVCFVSADASMDAAGGTVTGSLWQLRNGVPQVVRAGPLGEVNAAAEHADRDIATAIAAGEVDGVILISADPAGVNRATVSAAADHGLPAAGSGGSSVAAAEARGVHFVSASGTTGTTNHTRAISYTAGFARQWSLRYRAVDLPRTPGELWRRYDPRPVLVDALPAVLAIALVLGLSTLLGPDLHHRATTLLVPLVAVVIAVTASTRTSGVGQAGLVAGVVGGFVAQDTGLLGALLTGFLAGTLADVLVTSTLRWRWPATGANITGSGLAGLVAGLPVRALLGVHGHDLDVFLTGLLTRAVAHAGIPLGALLGLLMWPFVLRGLYHSVILPLMVVEFAARGTSFLAAADMMTLVVVSAGIAVSSILLPYRPGDRGPARRTLFVNALFGTYVEGSYPAVTRSRGYRLLTMACAAVGGAAVGAVGGTGVVYIPVPLLPLSGHPTLGLTWAVLATFALTTLAFLVANVTTRRMPPAPPPA